VQPYGDYRGSEPNAPAMLSALTGAIGVALAPGAIELSMRSSRVTLIVAVIAIAAGCTPLGAAALWLAKRARISRSISLGRIGGAKLGGLGRLLGIFALSLGLSAFVTLAVYAVLSSR
jgi:hypothetical protein